MASDWCKVRWRQIHANQYEAWCLSSQMCMTSDHVKSDSCKGGRDIRAERAGTGSVLPSTYTPRGRHITLHPDARRHATNRPYLRRSKELAGDYVRRHPGIWKSVYDERISGLYGLQSGVSSARYIRVYSGDRTQRYYLLMRLSEGTNASDGERYRVSVRGFCTC